MDERQEFEKWVVDESDWGYDATDFGRTDDGAYLVPDIDAAFQAWRARGLSERRRCADKAEGVIRSSWHGIRLHDLADQVGDALRKE